MEENVEPLKYKTSPVIRPTMLFGSECFAPHGNIVFCFEANSLMKMQLEKDMEVHSLTERL